jgi:leukotriene-A4 hydrolase
MNKYFLLLTILMAGIVMVSISCRTKESSKLKNKPENMDQHSFAQPNVAKITHLNLNAEVDFQQRQINGIANYSIQTSTDASQIILDTKGLTIHRIHSNGAELAFTLEQENPILGSALVIELNPDTQEITIEYTTSPQAEALQWLEPVQTSSVTDPFLFTQSQAILARSWIPVQDSPGIRFTYNATITVPSHLMALMSATNPQQKTKDGVYHFEMPQPIPAYLMALAAGNINFKTIGPRTGVYAEPAMIEKAAFEFAELEEMLEAAERLYGPYQWERYDILVLPPSFPFGGMENPRLTFATPTIIAGDRSLTSLVAHELAHSWSGNLVTNATWNDFWLNEGFTVYFERRIMEAMYGTSYAEMLAQLGKQDLLATIQELKNQNNPEDTRLQLNLENRNPDDGVTDIAYEKGYFFLRMLEEQIGKEKFDDFLKTYFDHFAFQSITTEDFIQYLHEHYFDRFAIDKETTLYQQWIFEAGLPDNMPEVSSQRFVQVEQELERFLAGANADDLSSAEWTTHEWLHFIRHLPGNISWEQLDKLDLTFEFSRSGNAEIMAAWFIHAIRHQYEPAYPSLEKFLMTVGRRKFLIPLYSEMKKHAHTREKARAIYQMARPNYHFVTINTLDELLGYAQ